MPADEKDAADKTYAGKGLDRDVIVQAALDSIDRNGSQGLTMRGLGQDLGVEAMSLYRYVSGREDLLEAVVAVLLSGLSDLDDQLGKTWQGYLQGLAHAVRRIAVEHPAAFPLVATRHPAAPWLRPPLRSLELVEDFLSTLNGFGFTDEQVVGTYRAFSGFLLGHPCSKRRSAEQRPRPSRNHLTKGMPRSRVETAGVDLSGSPMVKRFQPLLSEDRSAEEFEISLETLLDRLEAGARPVDEPAQQQGQIHRGASTGRGVPLHITETPRVGPARGRRAGRTAPSIAVPRRHRDGTMTDTTVQRRGGLGLRSFARLPPAVLAAAAVALLANSADTYALFVLLWIAGPQGWSGAETALMVLALRLPTLVSGPLAGRADDRWGARPIMLIDLAGRALLVTLMATSGRDGTLSLLPVLVLGGLAGGLSPATYAAVRSLIPRLVAGQQLGRANAVVALSDQMPLLLGAVLVGPSLILWPWSACPVA